ncbi:MAG TPA: nucleotidyltransferase family protein [Caproiciproducens sp.]|nr:nucleotidyltransferase family protein [Caproiciproducens sp.]
MLIAGIISEYNPFHLGHEALIQSTRAAGATHIAAVMSGNYVQRGEPAVLSKWARARQALLNGVDLIVELPLPWAISGAEKFAFGGVSILDALGADRLSFGSESGDAQELAGIADILLSEAFRREIRMEVQTGLSFARARQNAVARLCGPEKASLLEKPNNILAIEYLKALQTIPSPMIPFTISRVGPGHDSEKTLQGIASASQIRSLLHKGEGYSELMPQSAAAILQEEIRSGRAPSSLSRMERAVLAKLRVMNRNEFAQLPDVREGLENRIFDAVQKAYTLEEVYRLSKTKRYTHARIRRIVLSAFLGLTSDMCEGVPPYIRVIGLNSRGAEILRLAKQKNKIPVISHASDVFALDNRARNVFELESRATDLYALCLPKAAECGLDRTTGIISV